MKNRSYVYIIVAAVLWGSIGIFVKQLTACGMSNEQAIFIRVGIAAIGMAITALIRDRRLFKIRLRDIWMFVGTGAIGIATDNIFYFKSIELTSMGIAAMLMYTAPVFVMLMSAILFKERITRRKLLCLALTVAGSVFISNVLFSSNGQFSLTGVLCGIASGVGYALYSIFAVYALRRYKPMTVTLYTFIFATVTAAIFSNPAELFENYMSWNTLLFGLGLGVVACILPYFLYTKGLIGLEAGKASIIASLEPLAATVFGMVVYRETMTLSTGIGIALILAAIVLLNLQPSRKKATA